MELPRIAAVATAVPAQRFTQAELLDLAGYRDERRRGFFEASDIGGRHLYIDREHFRPNESVDELSDRFRRGALELGEAALRKALDRAAWRVEDVDFLATTTCTGRMTPSVDAPARARCLGGRFVRLFFRAVAGLQSGRLRDRLRGSRALEHQRDQRRQAVMRAQQRHLSQVQTLVPDDEAQRVEERFLAVR